MGERDRDDTRDAAEDAPPGSDTFHEGVLFEGLRPPLTLVQRRRRTAITTIIIVGALAVLFWPALSSLHGALPMLPSFARATATPSFSWRSGSSAGVITVSTGAYVNGVGSPVCPVTPQTPSSLDSPELHADSFGGDVWMLLLTGPTISVNSAAFMIWRVTGSGAFQVVANGPGSASLLPANGPVPHPGGSNWQRPGDEWDTNFLFPQPGCWQLQVTRGASLTASVWLIVAA